MAGGKLPLSIAVWDYDRTRPLLEGRILIEGVEPRYITLWVEEAFYRMLHHSEFDVSEMSLSAYVASLSDSEPSFIAIPVFLSRSFRHRSIYVNVDSKIEAPSDLRGKVVGIPRWRQTAGVWIRGIMEDYYGVPVDSVTYVVAGLEEEVQEGRMWTMPDLYPKLREKYGIEIKQESGKSLSAMLEAGEVDAIYSARAPSSFRRGGGKVRRLFPDYRSEEIRYFRETGIFPIMHTLVIRREVYEDNPWVAASLFKAFSRAKELAYRLNHETGALRYMLPWMSEEIEVMEGIAGEDYWPYGVDKNRRTLEAFLAYMYRQGLAPKRYRPEEIFAKETIDMFKIDAESPANLQ